MMKVTLALLALVAVTGVFATECHPNCKWQCDDPSCPAVCHPVCERPRCQMQCEEVSCAKCTIHCEKPVCTIRCPKDQCEKEDCPKCESVCKPARCHTTCSAPEPRCSPVCEELVCRNKCLKPTNCPKPKCELQCERAACHVNDHCCPCSGVNLHSAIALASSSCGMGLSTCSAIPTFLEVQNNMQLDSSNQCCPCAQDSTAAPAEQH